jgi:hypothetical protein
MLMKKGPQIKNVYSKAKEELERPLTDADVFVELPEKKCQCGNSFIPIIPKQRYCSNECFFFFTGVEEVKTSNQK